MSAWQFIAPAAVRARLLLGVIATTVYNPVSADLQRTVEADRSRTAPAATAGFAGDRRRLSGCSQRSDDGQSDHQRPVQPRPGRRSLTRRHACSAFDPNGQFQERIEAAAAVLEPGLWRLEDARVYKPRRRRRSRPRRLRAPDQPDARAGAGKLRHPRDCAVLAATYCISTWPSTAGLAAAGYRLQYQKLLARPFYAGGHGSACRRRQPTFLPLRRRAEDGFRWRRLRAFCFMFCRR